MSVLLVDFEVKYYLYKKSRCIAANNICSFLTTALLYFLGMHIFWLYGSISS